MQVFAQSKMQRILRDIRRDKGLYLLLIPGVAYFFIFCYIPLYGLTIAFRDYNIVRGFENAPWIGLDVFKNLFSRAAFQRALRNTIIISLLKIAACFPAPIILSLMINEVRNSLFKKYVQTTAILPHFMSWIVVYGLMFSLFNVTTGAVPNVIRSINALIGTNIPVVNHMSNKSSFVPLLVLSSVWKSAGYGTIVYLAAIINVDQTLYEAAMIDGAGRWRQLWNITLSNIRSTIVIMFILRVGSVMNAGFDQVFILSNPIVRSVSDIIDTYVYRVGMEDAKFSMATAAGLFQSVIGLALVLLTNWIARRVDRDNALI